jgi:hypothetical protein
MHANLEHLYILLSQIIAGRKKLIQASWNQLANIPEKASQIVREKDEAGGGLILWIPNSPPEARYGKGKSEE